MRISQAGIRSGLPTTRFATSSSSRREAQLGLRRISPTQMTVIRATRARVPLLTAVRNAARGVTPAGQPADGAPTSASRSRLRIARRDSVRWSQAVDGGSRRPRSRSAAPWRG